MLDSQHQHGLWTRLSYVSGAASTRNQRRWPSSYHTEGCDGKLAPFNRHSSRACGRSPDGRKPPCSGDGGCSVGLPGTDRTDSTKGGGSPAIDSEPRAAYHTAGTITQEDSVSARLVAQ